VINTDKAPTYRAAMAALPEEGTCLPTDDNASTGQILE
jgi:transposase-like protein